MKKAILSLGVFMLLLALAVAPAFAAEAINDNTGADSENWAIAAELDFDVVYNGNFALLHNFTFAGANTGWNIIPGNGNGNSIGTGSASAVANTSNFQNTNVSVIEGEDGDAALAKNFETGKNSENWAIAADVDAAVVWNENLALLCNFTYAGANSGFNHIGGPGLCNQTDPCEEGSKKNSITTGAASAEANTTNVQNTNLSMISVNGQGGSITAENNGTKKDSENIAVAANLDAAVIVNLNGAFARNATIAMANTGFNGISGDKKNDILTGAASAGANTSNFQNTNVSVIEQNGSGATTASNKETGKEVEECGEPEDSCPDNVAVAVDVEAAVVVNENLALLDNTTVAGANSGGNAVLGEDKNTITTGDASAGANTTNVQNTNVTVIGEGSCLFPDLCEPTCEPTCSY